LEGENLGAPAGKFCDLSKSLGIVDGEIGEHLTIQLDSGFFEAIHEPAVGEAIRSGGRVDSGDPERTEVTLSDTSIAVSVLEGSLHVAAGCSQQLAARSAIPFCLFQYFLASSSGRDRIADACHDVPSVFQLAKLLSAM